MLPWIRAARVPRTRSLLAALLLALTVLVAPTATASAAPAAEAATSRGWNDYSCKPSAAHPRPVVLVHGTFGNSIDNWLVLAPYLVNRGYCVFSLDYGQLPGVPFFHGLGPIDKSAEQLDVFVDKVLDATGAPKADLVGHSQGGMMPNYYLKFLGGAAKVNALVGIAPDNHGTTLLGLTKLLPFFPGVEKFISDKTPGLADQIAGSPFITKLTAGGDTVPGVRYTVVATTYDQVVTPYRTQYLDGPDVRNVRLQDLLPARPLRARRDRDHRPHRLPRGGQRPRSDPRHSDHLRLGHRLTHSTTTRLGPDVRGNGWRTPARHVLPRPTSRRDAAGVRRGAPRSAAVAPRRRGGPAALRGEQHGRTGGEHPGAPDRQVGTAAGATGLGQHLVLARGVDLGGIARLFFLQRPERRRSPSPRCSRRRHRGRCARRRTSRRPR
ncbi:hypothetical protein SBADM41S_00984 [Streptomyces badius]